MEFDLQMADIPVYVSCKFEMYISKIDLVISENVRIAFLYVLSIYFLCIYYSASYSVTRIGSERHSMVDLGLCNKVAHWQIFWNQSLLAAHCSCPSEVQHVNYMICLCYPSKTLTYIKL